MFEIFGIPSNALFGQLLIGLINGSFYALLSLGLAVIFGMLNIINFAHGAQYMMGAFVAFLLLNILGVGYWWALGLAPLIVGAVGIVIERTLLQWLYKLDHLYGLLLTFGLALIIEGLARNYYGSAACLYGAGIAPGRTNLGFMFLPNYRAWGDRVLAGDLLRHLVRHRAHQARLLPARRDREPDIGARLRHQRVADDHADLRVRRGASGLRRRDGGADLQCQPADGIVADHRGVRRGRDRRPWARSWARSSPASASAWLKA
jgi:hypothetical protein